MRNRDFCRWKSDCGGKHTNTSPGQNPGCSETAQLAQAWWEMGRRRETCMALERQSFLLGIFTPKSHFFYPKLSPKQWQSPSREHCFPPSSLIHYVARRESSPTGHDCPCPRCREPGARQHQHGAAKHEAKEQTHSLQHSMSNDVFLFGGSKAFWKTSFVALLWSCSVVAMSSSPTWMDARGPGGWQSRWRYHKGHETMGFSCLLLLGAKIQEPRSKVGLHPAGVWGPRHHLQSHLL